MPTSFDITEFGAKADGKTVNTQSIQQAIDACHDAGGGVVVCGAGTFVTGTLTLKSNVHLHVGAGCRIVGSTSLSDYPDFTAPGFNHERAPEQSSKCLIGAVSAQNIAITGAGTIDGKGDAFYDAKLMSKDNKKFAKPPTPRPRNVMFYRCSNVQLEDVTLVDSPCWTVWLMQCDTVHVHRVKIHADRRLRNVDGLDIDSCNGVTVSDCIIKTEDDCVVLRSMQPLYDVPVVCQNVTVTNCVLDSACQGVRVGCPSDGVVRNCTLSNLVIHSENNGINFDFPARYMSDDKATADIHDIMFSNVVIECDRSPIRIAVEQGIALPRVADITFSDMRIRSGRPILIQGSSQTVIENVRLSNIDLHTTGDQALHTAHCRGIKLSNVELTNI